MKKLQLLALSMLLSTPFAITYTSDTAALVAAAPAAQDDSQDNQNDRQARRQARIAGYQDIKASMEELCNNDDAVEAKKAVMQNQLLAQHKSVSDQLQKLPAQGDALLNALDERDMLQEKLTDRKKCLEDRIDMIQSWIGKKQTKIDREQASFDVKNNELSELKTAGITTGARVENLKSQLEDIQRCITDKKHAIKKLHVKLNFTQKSLQDLKDSKATDHKGMIASAANAVNDAASAVAKSTKKMFKSK